jgi:hypothetical protein
MPEPRLARIPPNCRTARQVPEPASVPGVSSIYEFLER